MTSSGIGVERFVRGLIAWRWLLLLVALAAAAVCYTPAQQLSLDRSIENMFAPGDPILEPYGRLKQAFGANDIVLAAYVDPHLMTSAGLARLGRLTAQLQQVPGVSAVLSLNNGPLGDRVADADNPFGRALVELFEGYTIGADHQTTAVVCLLDPAVSQAEVVDGLRAIVTAHDPTGTIVGEPVMVVDGFRLLDADGRRLGRISLVLLVAFFYQLVLGELPCPLCLLQRGAFVALGMGFLLNIRFGSSTAHYGIILIGAVIGAATSLRQVLLHIKPGDAGYGSGLLGLHFYSWALIAFMASIVYAGVLLFIEAGNHRDENAMQDGFGRAALWLFLLVAGNLVSTLLECGIGPCADNPTGYLWLQG